MQNIADFIQKNNVESTSNLISNDDLVTIQNKLGISFGHQLTEYILKFGYLAFGAIEFYGINSCQGFASDMVKQTLYLHSYYPCTNPFVALENSGDGYYHVVDSRDNVFEFIPEQDNKLIDTGMMLFDFVLKRFEEES